MAFEISVMVKALNIKGMHVDRVEYVADEAVMYGETYRHDHMEIYVNSINAFSRHALSVERSVLSMTTRWLRRWLGGRIF